MSLKDIQIKALKAREKIYRIADGDGLAIEVRTNGAKFWRYRYRFAGKAGMLSIGEYPMVSLLVARKMRDDARELLAQGVMVKYFWKEFKLLSLIFPYALQGFGNSAPS